MEQSMAASRVGTTAEGAPNTMHAKDMKPEDFIKPYLEFMTGNPTVFHAVGYFKEKLVKAGYREVGSRRVTASVHR